MDELSNQELKSALTSGDLSPRKKAVAREILRRRYESKHGRLWKVVWLPVLLVLGLVRTATGRFGRPKIDGN